MTWNRTGVKQVAPWVSKTPYPHRRLIRMRQCFGVTAIELAVVVALIVIVIGLAIPAFSSFVERWRVNRAISELQNVMNFAKVQAIRTRSHVVIAANPASCRSSPNMKNWSCGLTVFQDTNDNNVKDQGEPVLREVPEFHALTVMHAGGSNTRLVYGPHGPPIANPSRFEIYPSGAPDSPAAKTICLSFGGRMRIKQGSGAC